jgi:hypothetical protein
MEFFVHCYECSQAGDTRDAVGLCHHCSAAREEHVCAVDDPVSSTRSACPAWLHGLPRGRAEQSLTPQRIAQSIRLSPQTKGSVRASRREYFPVHLRSQIPPHVCPQSPITAMPNGKLHAPYFMQWSLGIEHQLGTTASVQAQYVGTRFVSRMLT